MAKYISPKKPPRRDTSSGIPFSVEDYLDNGAAEGERNNELFKAAAQLRDIDMSEHQVADYLMVRAKKDGLGEPEALRCIQSAFQGAKREAPRGKGSATQRAAGREYTIKPRPPAASGGNANHAAGGTVPVADTITIADAPSMPLPTPVARGFEALLMAAFEEGEGVCVGGTFLDDEGTPKPDSGVTLSREVWLKKVRAKAGDFAKMHTSKDGHFIRLNPMKVDPKSRNLNADVTCFRHVLVEFDKDATGDFIDKEKQLGALLNSGLPITALIDSGNKSIHAWVKVDAPDLETYKERAARIYGMFNEDDLDQQNHNPNRYSRAPDGERTIRKGNVDVVVPQRLLKTGVGSESWDDFEANLDIAQQGEVWTMSDLRDYDVRNDPNTVIGDRWMCKGGSFVMVSQSGVGKSSIQMQIMLGWALNRDDMTFGMKPIKPLKQIVIQAENDQGDVAEAFQHCHEAYSVSKAEELQIEENVKWIRLSSIAGERFLRAVRQRVAMERPDVCWIDPLVNYIGDDISKAEVISEFCDIGLGAIAREFGTIFGIIHHSGKPKAAADKQGQSASDAAYLGLGSSMLTNWARDVLVLNRVATAEPTDAATFTLTACKRRTRAGFRFMGGDDDPIDELTKTAEIHVKHSDDGKIYWKQCPAPVVEEAPKRGRGRPKSKDEEQASKSVGRPSSLSPDQKRMIVDIAAEGKGRIKVPERLKLAKTLNKSPKTISRYLKKLEEAAALAGGWSMQDALEADIANESATNGPIEVEQGSELPDKAPEVKPHPND